MPPTTTAEERSVAGAAADETKSVARAAADEARSVAHDATNEVRKLMGDARSQLRSQANEQSDRLAGSLQDVGHQLRTMAEKADDPESPVTSLTRQAADTADRFASHLQDGGVDRVMDDVKRFARNRPGVFLAGALAAGFVVGRMVKAVDIGEVVKGDSRDQDDVGGMFPETAADPLQPYATAQPAYPVPETTEYPLAERTQYPSGAQPAEAYPTQTPPPRPEQWNR
jgi:hypothetical protein